MVVCTDNDEAGEAVRKRYPNLRYLIPLGKDWNDDWKSLVDRNGGAPISPNTRGKAVIGERIAIADELSRASEEVWSLTDMLSTMAESDEEKERSSVYVFISHFLESHSERLERVVETLERGGAEK